MEIRRIPSQIRSNLDMNKIYCRIRDALSPPIHHRIAALSDPKCNYAYRNHRAY
jgi:hypothetical protein